MINHPDTLTLVREYFTFYDNRARTNTFEIKVYLKSYRIINKTVWICIEEREEKLEKFSLPTNVKNQEGRGDYPYKRNSGSTREDGRLKRSLEVAAAAAAAGWVDADLTPGLIPREMKATRERLAGI